MFKAVHKMLRTVAAFVAGVYVGRVETKLREYSQSYEQDQKPVEPPYTRSTPPKK